MKKIKGILFFILGITLPLSAMKPNDKKITDIPTELLWTLADSDNPAKALKWMNNLAQTNKELHKRIFPEILTYLSKKEAGKSDNYSIMQTASKHGLFSVIEHVKKQTPTHIDNLNEIQYIKSLFENMDFVDVIKILHRIRATSKHKKNQCDHLLEYWVKKNPNLAKFFVTIATEHGFPKILELVLKHSKIDINHISFVLNNLNYNFVPLSRAIEFKSHECVKLLLKQNKIDVNKPDSQGMTPLMRAINGSNLRSLRLLLKNDKVKVNKTVNGKSALQFAIDHQAIEELKMLLNHPDIDVNKVITKNPPPLPFLTMYPRINVNKLENFTQYPLFCAVYDLLSSGKEPFLKIWEICKLLLAHSKIDVNKTFYNGNTLLLFTIRCHINEVSQELLNHPKIDVNKPNNSGKTPLVFAVKYKNIPALNMLLKHPNIRPNVHKLFHLAKDNDEIYEILKAWTKRKKISAS